VESASEWRSHKCGFILVSSTAKSQVMQSSPSVRVSVLLCPLYLLNRRTFDLDLLHVSRADHRSQAIEGQGHRSRPRLWVRLMRSVLPRSRTVFLVYCYVISEIRAMA